MEIKIKLDTGEMPTRAHRWDAGLDLYAKEGTILHRYSHETIGTGLHIQALWGWSDPARASCLSTGS